MEVGSQGQGRENWSRKESWKINLSLHLAMESQLERTESVWRMSCRRHRKWICWEILRVGRRHYMVSAEWLQTDSSGNSNTPLHSDHEMVKWVLYPPEGIYGGQIWQSPLSTLLPWEILNLMKPIGQDTTVGGSWWAGGSVLFQDTASAKQHLR